MSRCRVEKRVWRDPFKTSDFTCLYYELEVDETPRRGHELNEGRWYSGPVNFVIWDLDAEQFNCRVDDEVPCADQDFEYSYEFLVENAVAEGWKVSAVWGAGAAH